MPHKLQHAPFNDIRNTIDWSEKEYVGAYDANKPIESTRVRVNSESTFHLTLATLISINLSLFNIWLNNKNEMISRALRASEMQLIFIDIHAIFMYK